MDVVPGQDDVDGGDDDQRDGEVLLEPHDQVEAHDPGAARSPRRPRRTRRPWCRCRGSSRAARRPSPSRGSTARRARSPSRRAARRRPAPGRVLPQRPNGARESTSVGAEPRLPAIETRPTRKNDERRHRPSTAMIACHSPIPKPSTNAPYDDREHRDVGGAPGPEQPGRLPVALGLVDHVDAVGLDARRRCRCPSCRLLGRGHAVPLLSRSASSGPVRAAAASATTTTSLGSIPASSPSTAVTVESPTTSSPHSRAAIASGTVDIPSTSAPHPSYPLGLGVRLVVRSRAARHRPPPRATGPGSRARARSRGDQQSVRSTKRGADQRRGRGQVQVVAHQHDAADLPVGDAGTRWRW